MAARERHSDADAVAHVEKTPTTHASGMRDLIGLGLNVRQGEPSDAMRVDLELNCGTTLLILNGGGFTLSLRCCFVALEMVNCEVHPHTRYQFQLIDGSVEASSTETRERSHGGEAGVGVEASVKAGPGGFLPRLKGWGSAGRSRKVSGITQETVRRQPRVDLIVTAGQDRWQVGDPTLGDARRGDGRLLGSYFGEQRCGDEEPSPLCVVAVPDATSPSTMTASALVRLGQLQVHLGDEPATEDQVRDLGEVLARRGRRASVQHRRHEGDLRSRMAGLVLGRAMQAAQRKAGIQVFDGEVLIARQTLVAASRRALKGVVG